ncbi:hypothetical protein CKO40_09015 [Halochromatium glycolicum]|uniref:Uncharacterized protein n=2 Tax=Halochromatium glycolicum TaxID=85075 RepID=A0AAJ0U3R8_9GAMM|nr:hypothetical protein [Halochromatium glycolicum]
MTDTFNRDDWYKHDPDQRRYAAGNGSWLAITPEEFEAITAQAKTAWRSALEGIAYPWLCWSVASDWCLVQQRLVRSVGWTPIVGYDPRADVPPIIDGAILMNFNKEIGFPKLTPMVPMELTYLFAPRLAFWHSDLLVREPLLRKIAELFKALSDGEMAAVDDRQRWHQRIRGNRGRYWELLGCTTRGASQSNFAHGCGWWRRSYLHPNCQTEEERNLRRRRYTWDHGAGILAWQELHNGKLRPLRAKPLQEGHCTKISNKRYIKQSPNNAKKDLTKDLVFNYDLNEVCIKLGLAKFL